MGALQAPALPLGYATEMGSIMRKKMNGVNYLGTVKQENERFDRTKSTEN